MWWSLRLAKLLHQTFQFWTKIKTIYPDVVPNTWFFDLSVKLDGSILFPEIGSISVAGETFSDVKEKLSNIILNILKDKSDLIDKKSNLEKLNFENSWNDVNQKLQKIINEN